MFAPVTLLLGALVLGATTWVTVQESPQFSDAASVPGGIVLLLATTWLCTLAAAGWLWWGTHSRRTGPVLLGLAGLSLLVPEWDNPDAPPLLYSASLLLEGLTPALLVHAVLTWREGRLVGAAARVTVVSGYLVFFGVVGVATAVVLDPAATGCIGCPDNPWLVSSGGVWLAWAERIGGIAAVLWLTVVGGLLAHRLMRGTRAPRHAAMLLPALAFVVIAAARYLTELGWDMSDRSPAGRALWVAGTLAMAGTAVGALGLLLARRKARRRMGRLLLDLASSQEPGNLQRAFVDELGDPTVQLLYPTDDGTLVDARGRPVQPAATAECGRTPLQSDGVLLGVLVHASPTAIARADLAELVAATRLGLENEALTARARAEEHEITLSGLRLLTTRDTERRRLERDLHDGAQQRLVGAALGLQLLARTCPGEPVETARRRLGLAIEELRAIAQGLAPPVLDNAGLPAALRSLAETRDLCVTASAVGRFARVAETTLYQLVERATRDQPADATLDLKDPTTLRAKVAVRGDLPDLAPAEDRVLTLGGRMAWAHEGDHDVIEVELPVEGLRQPSVVSPAWTDGTAPGSGLG